MGTESVTDGAGPEIAVVVPSHDRPLRLRWLLNALAEQTLARDRFEVIVGHDSAGPETEALLRSHPLASAGVLRHVTLEPGSAPPGRNRNAAWRLARAPIIAFTDDDCRPPPEWLEQALGTARRHPGAIVQGATAPDPDEGMIGFWAPWVASQSIVPPRPWAQACNIVYPKDVLEDCGGFPEDMYVGEDTALAETARARGVPYVGAAEVLTFHAIHEASLPGIARAGLRWGGLPLLIKRHPRLRQEFPLGLFYRREHLWLLVAAVGWTLMRRSRLASLLLLPYVAHRMPAKYARIPRGRMRATLELPGLALIDAVEIAGMVRGSVRHRTPYL